MAKTMQIAGWLTFAGGALLVSSSFMGVDHHLAVMLPFFLMSIGHGIHQPCGQTGAIAPFAHAAGTASALNGFLMMFFAFLTSLCLSYLQTHLTTAGTLPLVYAMGFWALVLASIAWTAVQKNAIR
jgi:MFS transporter, DHA1 family, multidrug resistance protein